VNRLHIWIVLTVIASRITVSHELAVLQHPSLFCASLPMIHLGNLLGLQVSLASNAGVLQAAEVWDYFRACIMALLSLGSKNGRTWFGF